ncbi:hypothetical protein BZG35_16340 [Brevundimonas sp. LM2]|uniref:DUF1353 domain-containing protein n=1 Tax=Brevundimonas sp. LM2 TaxID=1938605 RepID=UPI000983A813|nr:hypothetical protein BZG35_16340 [Brevundimonas sp. LM2]
MPDQATTDPSRAAVFSSTLSGAAPQPGGLAIRDGRSLWALQRAIFYCSGCGRDEEIIVPAKLVKDPTSIPRLVWSFNQRPSPRVNAAIEHDSLYDTEGDGQVERNGRGRRLSNSDSAHCRRNADGVSDTLVHASRRSSP